MGQETVNLPPTDELAVVLGALVDAGAEPCVGGSGLLAALGLVDLVNDWDVTTDAPVDLVRQALDATGLPVTDLTGGDGYATGSRLAVGAHVDVIVGFAIRTADGVVELPARTTRTWRGLPIADPAVWARAYRLLGRPERADALDAWLRAD